MRDKQKAASDSVMLTDEMSYMESRRIMFTRIDGRTETYEKTKRHPSSHVGKDGTLTYAVEV